VKKHRDQLVQEPPSEALEQSSNTVEAGFSRPDNVVEAGFPGPSAVEGSRPADTAQEPSAIERERDEYKDLLLRKTAEFENFRKRTDRERQAQSETAAFNVIQELVPLVDDLERALNADPGSAGAEAYRKGVELIHRQLLDILRRRGVKPIEALGADFDPNFHQAVVQEVSSEHREGEVMQELQRGYMLGDRLLRPAMVKVAKSS
jgi:molecular chaperone GrpE